MQLRLTIEELELLRQILRDEDQTLCDGTSLPRHAMSEACSRDKLQIGRELSGMQLSRTLQLGWDELEDLADSLDWHKRKLAKEISFLQDLAPKSKLEHELVTLQHLLEKVTEACAMV